MSASLIQKKCVPCEGGESPLTVEQAKALQVQTPDWAIDAQNASISRTIVFRNFRGAVAFIDRVAALAEAEGHHPDINLHDYKRVTFTLSTHAIDGLSENDFILSAKIDRILLKS